jgi:hypothetical protein
VRSKLLLVMLAVTLAPAPGRAEDAVALVQRSQEAFYYAGTDLKARVKMTLRTKEGQQRLRDLTISGRMGPLACNGTFCTSTSRAMCGG